MSWAVSIVWLNGVKSVTLFKTQEQAVKHANAMLEFKGVRVFIGAEVERSQDTTTAQATSTTKEKGND